MVFYDKKFQEYHGNNNNLARQEAQKLVAHAEQMYALKTANDICDHLTMPKLYFDVHSYVPLGHSFPDDIFTYIG